MSDSLQSPSAPFVPDPAWCPQQMIEWLSIRGREIKEIEQLLTELGDQFIQRGVPVYRIRVSLPTLNPAVSRRAFTWWRNDDQIEIYSAPHSITQSSDYIGSPVHSLQVSGKSYRNQLRFAETEQLHPQLKSLVNRGVTDYLVVPIKFTFEDTLSPWILATDQPEGFSDEDIEKFHQVSRYLAPLLEVLALHLTTKSLLNTYLGARTGQRVLNGKVTRGDSELIEAVIWYSDMRNSTAMAEALDHHQLLNMLNCYFEIISRCVAQQKGEVLRFIGDALLVVFPGDQYPSLADAGRAALLAAENAQAEIEHCNQKMESQGLPSIRYGLGLDVGTVIYGNVGGTERLDFTVMGSAVNRAARIESLTKMTDCSLLVSEPMADLLQGEFCWKGAYPVAGLDLPLTVYCAKCSDT